MRSLPLSIGTIHFIGIGGIGMSGIAEVLCNLGYQVHGSDIAENANVARLRGLGARLFIGHHGDNVRDAAIVVVSTAIQPDNPELEAARRLLIPIVHRAEMLAELMRLKWSIACAGTHGKTTTTSLVATVLDHAGLDPTIVNGGIINAYGTNARLGGGDWMVVEADESDGSFNKLPATIAVVTNIDPEHLDHHGDFAQLQNAFQRFVQNLPFYGFAALCIDHPVVQAMIPRVADRRIVTYGFSPQADVRGDNLRATGAGVTFDVTITNRADDSQLELPDLHLPMFGAHNVQNALAAVLIGHEMGLTAEVLRGALAKFAGVKRRFTKVGVSGGVTVIDDYGHHPVEIAAVLKAARDAASDGRVIAVVQPHRFSRLRDLFDDFCSCFNDADMVLVADVHAAGEAPLEGIDRDALVAGLQGHGHRAVASLPSPDALPAMIAERAAPGDFVICLGAGSITTWAAALPAALDHLRDGAAPMEARRP
ncbi:MAG: UDP-N-acetylmuramate--L-alanine ligase [Pseudomonadota bacterium]|nr:UDP-N-acetylmuramate--L-alanine ligase [Pseudomonadota bacterium]MEC8182843.1 UDP-N-acetylmuramate--L-alanine ligase [Pseudomonadota bacterium]MEC8318375.1 UDP-N-acetylmuramate--L-alanine ligase [Pseudomonadota bacterium]MEC8387442.1 UDP-N-acetylmuramate--L-alanine ligase [Pseudomonadota bacterium]